MNVSDREWNGGRQAPYDEPDAPEFEPVDELQCSVCGAWLDEERLRLWNEKGDEEEPATCLEHEGEYE